MGSTKIWFWSILQDYLKRADVQQQIVGKLKMFKDQNDMNIWVKSYFIRLL
jgi:hypothetical protein